MRPTPKAALLLALGLAPALLIVTGLPDLWATALYWPVAVLAAVVLDLTLIPPRGRLAVQPELPTRLYVGERGEVKLHAEIEDLTRPLLLTALLELDGAAEEPEPVAGLMKEGRLTLGLPVTPLQRGRLGVPAVWLKWRGPLGLVEARVRVERAESPVDVIPDVRGIHEAALQFFARDAALGLKSQRLRGEGAEFDNLCEYAPGMDNRFIDWKRSARHRKLLCKEFRQERNHQIVFGFDTGHLMLEPAEGLPKPRSGQFADAASAAAELEAPGRGGHNPLNKLDQAIRSGLLLSWVSLHNGDLVGGCGFDARFRSYIKPGRGLPYFTQMQRFTAGLSYNTTETNFTIGLAELNYRLKRRALIILFTDFVDAVSAELLLESLNVLTRRHLVLFVTMRDPLLSRLREAPPDNFGRAAQAVIADDFLRERSIVLERVARLGVQCLEAPARDISAGILNRYLMIKQRGLL